MSVDAHITKPSHSGKPLVVSFSTFNPLSRRDPTYFRFQRLSQRFQIWGVLRIGPLLPTSKKFGLRTPPPTFPSPPTPAPLGLLAVAY